MDVTQAVSGQSTPNMAGTRFDILSTNFDPTLYGTGAQLYAGNQPYEYK